jgi:hypothetical protein
VLTAPRRATTHARAARAAVLPTLRASALGSAVLTAALAVVPLIVTVARGGTNLLFGSIAAAVLGGAVVAWAADDEFGDTLAAAPVRSAERLAIRLLAVVGVVVGAWAIAAVAAAAGPGLPPMLGERLPEAAAAATLGAGVALTAARRGERAVGPIGVIAGVLSTLVVAGLALRWAWLPTFLPSSAHGRWWLVALAGGLLVMRSGRDAGQP